METITHISSVSHNGMDMMWYPFSAHFSERLTLLGGESIHELEELLSLIKSMFEINNHHPEILSKYNNSLSQQLLIGKEDKKTTCEVKFETYSSRYTLKRCFVGKYSVEARLFRQGTSVVYNGHDAIRVLRKMILPVIQINERLFANRSVIFSPLDNFSKRTLVSLANHWLKMVNITDSNFLIDSGGRWKVRGDLTRFQTSRRNSAMMPSIHNFLSKLAQTVVKKRTFGMSIPVLCSFDVKMLNDFETMTVLDLVNTICKDETIQLVLAVNREYIDCDSIEIISVPALAIYET